MIIKSMLSTFLVLKTDPRRILFSISFWLVASVLVNETYAASYEWYATAWSQAYEKEGDVQFNVLGSTTMLPAFWIASANGEMLGYHDGDLLSVKQYDRKTTPVGDDNVTFVLACYGELLSAESIETSEKLPLCAWDSHEHEGGLVINAPSDFYLGFMVPESKTSDGVVRYGWYHLSFEDGYDEIKLLDSGIGLYGENVLVGVGAVPEPTAAMLLMLGVSGLVLRRRRDEGDARRRTGGGMNRT